jgi:hypothetical protein
VQRHRHLPHGQRIVPLAICVNHCTPCAAPPPDSKARVLLSHCTDGSLSALNNRNALASLTKNDVLEILRHLSTCSLLCYKCVYRSWNHLISNNYKVLPQIVVGFFYDGEKGERNFTSVTGECPNLSFLSFPIDKVAILDCCNGLVLCLCIEAARSCYVIYNPATKNLWVLLPSIHVVGQARLGFDPM